MLLTEFKGKILGFLLFSLLINFQSYSQCVPTVTGKNLVQNPGFEMGDTLFSTPLNSWNDPAYPPPGRWWSMPGEYWIHGVPGDFNADGGFSGTPRSGSKMMLVDAKCEPGQTIWEQQMEVIPGTNYYFSVWISTLKVDSPARLKFEVNGATLGEEVNAPAVKNSWLFYEDVWYSGTMEGTVTLRIKEQNGVGCEDGDDFALDDISFIPGCEFGSPGPEPELGPDVTLCGTSGVITLNSGLIEHPNINITWSTGDTTSTITVNKPGIYAVCVDSAGSCKKSDVIEVLDDFSISLGPDVDLCSPASVTLDAGFSGFGVRYIWKKDGVTINGERSQTLFVNTPGTYVVEVTDPNCGMRSDEVVVTSSTLIATNHEFCPPGVAPLSVTGPGALAWYDQPVGGTKVAVGNTFTTPTLTETKIYYVQDTSIYKYGVGPVNVFQGGYPGGNRTDHSIVFQTFNNITLDSVTVYPVAWNAGTMNVGVTIYDMSTGGNGTVVARVNRTVPVVNNGGNPTTPAKIFIGVALEEGKTYRITSEGTSGGQLFYHDQGTAPVWPYTIRGVISLIGLSAGEPAQAYGYFYDWVVTSGAPCDRVPVVAKAYCPPTCEMPVSVNLQPSGTIDLCDATEILTAITSPVFSYQYEFFKDGVSVQGPSGTNNLTVAEEGVYAVMVTDGDDPEVCYMASANVIVENTGLPDPPGPITASDPTCVGTDVIYSIDPVNNARSYSWSVPAGSQIIGDATGNSITVRIGNTSGYVKVTPVNITCGDGPSDSLALNVEFPASDAGKISGGPNFCAGTTMPFSIDPVDNATSYVWEIPAGSQIINNNGTSIDLQLGTTPGNVIVRPINTICGNGLGDTLFIDITDKADDAALINPVTKSCNGRPVTFTVASSANAESYQWEVPADASVILSADMLSAEVTFGNSSGYVKVTPINLNCGNGQSDSVLVNVDFPSDDAGPVTGDQIPCGGSIATYTIDPVNRADTYIWEIPEGATIVSPQPTTNTIQVQFGEASGYVKVTPSNSICGAGQPQSLLVDVSKPADDASTINGSARGCIGRTGTYSVSGIQNAESFEWTIPNGSTFVGAADGASIEVLFGTTSGNITVTPINTRCGNGAPATLFVEMNDTPGPADLTSAPDATCEGVAVTYTVSDVQYADSYRWDVPQGTVVSGSGTTVNITFAATSGYVIVTPVGYCANGEADSVYVDVTPSVTPTISIDDPGFVCEGSPATFTATTQHEGTDPRFEWYLNDVPQGINAKIFNSSFVEPGDVIRVELLSNAECITEDTARGFVTISGFSAGISRDTTACAPDSVILVAGGGWIYHWYKEPGVDLMVEDDTLIVKESGVYYATVTAGQCTRTVRREVVIYTPPVMQIDPQVTEIALGESFYLQVDPLMGERPFRYEWMSMNEEVLSRDSTYSGTPIFLNGGEVQYQLEVTDKNGCKARDTALVIIKRIPLVIPNLITANGDHKNDVLFIQGLTPNSKIMIYNRWGALVYSSNNYDNDWGGEGVSDSIYYYHLVAGITGEEHKGWVHVVN